MGKLLAQLIFYHYPKNPNNTTKESKLSKSHPYGLTVVVKLVFWVGLFCFLFYSSRSLKHILLPNKCGEDKKVKYIKFALDRNFMAYLTVELYSMLLQNPGEHPSRTYIPETSDHLHPLASLSSLARSIYTPACGNRWLFSRVQHYL